MAKISYDVEALDLLRKNVGDVETAFSELEKKTLTITNSLLRVLKGGTTTNFDKIIKASESYNKNFSQIAGDITEFSNCLKELSNKCMELDESVEQSLNSLNGKLIGPDSAAVTGSAKWGL